MLINPYKIVEKADSYESKQQKQYVNINELYNIVISEFKDVILSEDIQIVAKNIEEYILKKQLDLEFDIEQTVQKLIDRIYGYGILEKYIKDKITTDIRVVSPELIYIKQKGKWKKAMETFQNEKELEDYVRFCALKNNSVVNFESPIAIFSDRKNHLRIEAGIVPANIKYASLVIRLHKEDSPQRLPQLVGKNNMLDEKCLKIIKQIVRERKNIILCGKGGSGKTTLMRAIINEVPPYISITSNEETAELYLNGRNVIQRECIFGRDVSKNVSLEQLMRHSLVMSSDMIIAGELKGAEASTFFDAISTGHIGLATVHSDCAENTIDRLITLIKKEPKAQYYTENFLKEFLSKSIDYIIYLQDFKVNQISKIKVVNSKVNFEHVYER